GVWFHAVGRVSQPRQPRRPDRHLLASAPLPVRATTAIPAYSSDKQQYLGAPPGGRTRAKGPRHWPPCMPSQSLVRTAPTGQCCGLPPPLSRESPSTVSDDPAQPPPRLIRGRLTGPAPPAPKAEARDYQWVETHLATGQGPAQGRGPGRRP